MLGLLSAVFALVRFFALVARFFVADCSSFSSDCSSALVFGVLASSRLQIARRTFFSCSSCSLLGPLLLVVLILRLLLLQEFFECFAACFDAGGIFEAVGVGGVDFVGGFKEGFGLFPAFDGGLEVLRL